MSNQYQDFGFTTAAASHMHQHFMGPLMALTPTHKPRLRVLDVGCGNGYLAGAYAALGHEVVGIDLSEQGVSIARKAYPGARFEVLAADDQVLQNLATEPFDLVVSTEVVEHLYAPRPFIQGCMSALAPGGRLIITTPYHGYLKNLLISLKGGWDQHADPLWDGGHIKLWSYRTLSRLLADGGFSNFQFRGAGRLPWLWMTMIVAADKAGS
jgi:2-polyprenyl-3-methyl-5-hydroxy-6-metoxy-1,4-benzoquinol methylase